MAHHIGPGGEVEPCPPIQFARDTIHDGRPLAELFRDSEFLKAFRDFSRTTTRGCVIMEDPVRLHAFLEAQGALDSSGRGTAYQELAAMKAHTSHHVPNGEIPERCPGYRFAKKHWFFGFGAYG
jgi:hypothetical protein